MSLPLPLAIATFFRITIAQNGLKEQLVSVLTKTVNNENSFYLLKYIFYHFIFAAIFLFFPTHVMIL